MKEYLTYSYTRKNFALMPQRYPDSNKGSYGRLLCVCGSVGMAGAAAFAAKAALRMGAGLVKILTPSENLVPLQILVPEAIVVCYNSEAPEEEIICEALEWAQVVVIGCGLGMSRASLSVLSQVLKRGNVPTVIDADALNLMARSPSLWKYAKGAIITPHIAEMSRISGESVDEIRRDIYLAADEFARKREVICLLKSHRSAVSDGNRKVYVNTSGNSALATAGSGDVLSGIIGGILAQAHNSHASVLELVCLAAYIHGLCGENAAIKAANEYSVIARDIIDSIPDVLRFLLSLQRK